LAGGKFQGRQKMLHYSIFMLHCSTMSYSLRLTVLPSCPIAGRTSLTWPRIFTAAFFLQQNSGESDACRRERCLLWQWSDSPCALVWAERSRLTRTEAARPAP
jgi:hypothetical protein